MLSRRLNLVSCQLSTAATNALELATDNCEGILFVGVPGTTAARTWSMALKSGATTTGFVNCSSTFTHASSGAANHCIVTDVYKPKKRYIGATLSSTTATPCWMLAFKYENRIGTTGAFSSTAGISPASGGILRAISPSSST